MAPGGFWSNSGAGGSPSSSSGFWKGAPAPSQPSSGGGGGGILGAITGAAHWVGQKADLAARDIKSIPGGLVQAGEAAVHDLGQQSPGPSWSELIQHPVGAWTAHANGSHLAPLIGGTIQSTKTSFEHPLRDPFQTLLNAGAVASAGAGAVARAGAAADALRAGDVAGAAKGLVSKPVPAPRLLTSGEGTVALHPSANPAVRAVQGVYDVALQHALDTNPEGMLAAHAAKRIGGSIAETTRFQQRMREAMASDLERAGRQVGNRKLAQAALRLTSENSTPAEAEAFHAAQAANGVGVKANNALASLYKQVKDNGLLTTNAAGDVVVNADKYPELAQLDAKLAAGQTQVDQILKDYGLMSEEGLAARRDLPGQIRRAGAPGAEPVFAQPRLTLPEAQARLAELDNKHQAMLEKIVPEVSPYGGDISRAEQLRRNTMNGRIGRGKAIGASRMPTVKADELAMAEDKLHQLIAAHPEDPTMQRVAALVAERQQLRDLLNAHAEAGIAGETPPLMPAAGESRLVGFEPNAGRSIYGPQGRGYVPYKITEPKASRAPLSASVGPVVGKPQPFVTAKAFTGSGLEKGLVPDNTTGLLARHMRRAFKFVSTDEFRKAALETGSQVRRSSRDVLVRVPDEKAATQLPLEIERALGRKTVNLDELHGHEQALAGFLDRLIPGRGDNFYTDRAQAIGTEAPAGYRWVDRNVLGDLGRFRPTPHGKIASKVDAVNSAITAATVYFKVGHIGTRVLTNASTAIIQGAAAPFELAKSVRLWRALPDEDKLRALAAAGQHSFAAMPHEGEGFAGRIAGRGAQFWARHADAPFRFASLAYEARRAGYRTTSDFQRLLSEMEDPSALSPEERAHVEYVAKEANRAGIAYDRLNQMERNYISRAVWFYPWVKGSTAFAGHTFMEHPFKSAVLGAAGVQGRETQQSELGPLPSYEAGLLKLAGGASPLVSDFSTFSPFATPADVVQAVANPSGGAIAGFANPVVGAGAQLAEGVNQYGGASKSPYLAALLSLGSPTPEQQIAEAYAERGKDQSKRMFRTTPESALLRFLVGPAMPRRINLAAAAAAAKRQSGTTTSKGSFWTK